jgi:predicted MFS family arabinose efflux permease
MLLLPKVCPEQLSGASQLPAVLRISKVQVGLVAVVLIFTGQFAAYTYITPYLNRISGIESAQLSLFLLGYGVAGIFGNVLCGWCVERDVRLAVLSTALLRGCSMLLLVCSNHSLVAITAVVAW